MARVLVVDDELSIRETLEMFLVEKGHEVFKAGTGQEGMALFCEVAPDVVILDIRLPDTSGLDVLARMQSRATASKVIMITAFHDMETTIQAMKLGAYDYVHKPLDAEEMDRTLNRALYILEVDRETPLPERGESPPNAEVIIGKSKQMQGIFKMCGLLCQNRATVLIQGETGTGKELIARVIHRNSPYDKEPFVTLDCSAVVETLLESELFGHERGAFTGATQTKLGKIELAGRGTLFLDEVGELPLSLQGKFLGFLQRREYTRVGGVHTLKSSCRIIAASNRDLAHLVQQQAFKEDLYFRLRVVTIHVPPLVQRLSDISDLVNHFLRKINYEMGTQVFKLQKGVIGCLKAHHWNGNVRELENVLVEAVIRARGKVILLEEIEKILSVNHGSTIMGLSDYSLLKVEKDHILNTLHQCDWNRTQAARLLGMSLPTLRSKIRRYEIESTAPSPSAAGR
jgi:two-component system, NtrC family, response regulator AtoC